VRLAIELVATKDAEGLVLATFAGGETSGYLAPTDWRVLETVELGRPYVVRNMRLILSDAFHVPGRSPARAARRSRRREVRRRRARPRPVSRRRRRDHGRAGWRAARVGVDRLRR
jgi:hypothetical protein